MDTKMNPQSFSNLGAVERPKDSRDFGLAAYQATVPLPDTFMQDFSAIPVMMQNGYPTCGGHAGAALDSFLQKKPLSPKYLWKQIKLIDGFPNEMGTDMRSIMKVLTASGDCSLDLCPNDLGTGLIDYTDPSQLTDAMKHDAYHNDLQNYAFVDMPDWDALRQAIYQNKAVIARVQCGDGWWKAKNGQNSWAEADIMPLRLGNYTSGHFICLIGYDQTYIYFRNSWSAGWARGGDGYFDRSYLPSVMEIGTALVLPAAFVFTNNLWLGQRSNDVLQLQKRLGVMQTGFFGPLTLTAVMSFQKTHGIPATGFVGPITRLALNT
jgi:hypothetical protein